MVTRRRKSTPAPPPGLFGEQVQHGPTVHRCAAGLCDERASYGFGLRGRAIGRMTKFYCEAHRAHGEAYHREINGG